MKPTVWIRAGVVVIYGTNLDADVHQHHSLQLIWSKTDSTCKLNGSSLHGPAIVGSCVEHQLEMAEGWVVLVEPNSVLGEALSQLLDTQSIKTFELASYNQHAPRQNSDFSNYLTILFEHLAVPMTGLYNHNRLTRDLRINQLIAQLDLCLTVDCIKPSGWKASEVAAQLALSESRFLHLFSEEMGIAWRPYLLWRRMNCAIQAMVQGQSATQAAHLAGFSDSAHLSRTFRNNFGMSLRQAKTLFKAQ